jgi:hypothetical protein
MTSPEYEHGGRHPDPYRQHPDYPWTISGATGPAGAAELAHTVGLISLGVPELLIPAHAADGDVDLDPPWTFTRGDLRGLLNEFAEQLLDGRVAAGARLVEDVHHGSQLVRFSFTFGRPQAARSLGAAGLAPQTPVIAIRWGLQRFRCPAGPACAARPPWRPPDEP